MQLIKTLLILSLNFFLLKITFAQSDATPFDSLQIKNIETITVAAPKINTEINRIPIPIFKYTASPVQSSQQQLSLQEYIYNVPGLISMNANNYAQDLRISIRGFGARAAFGIRGIKIIVDGIPETTPDGQGQVDNLNIGIVQNIEVIRGPSSALFGNASGGVISINTLNDFQKNYVNAGLTFGSFNFQQYQVTSGFKTKNTKYILHGSRSKADGYREYSSFQNNNFNGRVFHEINNKAKINFLINYANSPEAEDPGGINSAAIDDDRKQAREENITFNAGEEISQLKLGVNFKYAYNKNRHFNTYAFYSSRDFYGRLPFENAGIIDLSREYLGTGGNYYLAFPIKSGLNKIQVGYDMATQSDNRMRFNNLNGLQDSLALNQLESFTNGGAFLVNQFIIGKWLFSAGLRYDWNKINVQDRMKENGNGSGERNLENWNPSLGISYELNNRNFIYANFSTSFETPSLNELSANPVSPDGFNPLDPQQANNYELGIKGTLKKNIRYELAVFHIDTKSELVPFELDTFPGQIFYQNAGSGDRNGLEFSIEYPFLNKWNFSAHYTFSDFTYHKFELNDSVNYNGNRLPGIPKHFGSATIQYLNKKGLHGRLQARYMGELFTSDLNTVTDDAYLLLNLNIGYQLKKDRLNIIPFLGVNNILNTEYNDNIRINAFGQRYFEPGPKINFYGGVRFRL
ncbi:MAG: TonB-dependent receptor [Bacteroidota bacterium]